MRIRAMKKYQYFFENTKVERDTVLRMLKSGGWQHDEENHYLVDPNGVRYSDEFHYNYSDKTLTLDLSFYAVKSLDHITIEVKT